MNNVSPQPRIVHLHIFKNGGSTLDWILRRNFGSQFMEFHGDTANSTLTAPDIAKMIKDHPDHIAFSSHHFRLPIDTVPNIFPLCFIRHPLDRIASIFEQERRMASADANHPLINSFSEWLQDALRNRPFIVCDAQVSFYARGGVYYEPPTLDCLEDAIDELKKLPFFGVVNEYDTSMVILEQQLKQWWPTFDAAFFPQNQSAREYELSERLARLALRLPPNIYDHLMRNNQYDLSLFEYASKLLTARAELIFDFDEQKAKFNDRCAALR